MILSIKKNISGLDQIQNNRCRIVALGLSIAAINYGITSWFYLIPLKSSYISYFISAIWLAYVLIKCTGDSRYFSGLIFTIFTVGGIFAINYVAFPSTVKYYGVYSRDLVRMFSIYIPTAVAIYMVYDYDLLLEYSAKIASIASIVLCSSYFIGLDNTSMAWGLRIMPLFFILNVYRYSNNGKWWRIVFWITFLFSLLGSRQNIVLIFLIMLCTDLLIKRERKRSSTFLVITGYILAATVVLLTWGHILDLLVIIIELLGISSKGLVSLADLQLLDSSNRSMVYDTCREIIAQNGMHFSGLFSDRVYFFQYFWGTWYAHNIYYELLISLGTLIGNIVVAMIVFLCVRFVRYSKNNMLYFGVGLIAISLGRLMVSDSYLINGYFYILMGMLLSTKKNHSYKSKLTNHRG